MAYPIVQRGAESARLLVELAEEHGVPPDACLRGTGIPESALRDPLGGIDPSQELALVRNLIRLLEDRPALGHEAGRRYRITTLGIWGYALLSSATVRSGTELGARYRDLTVGFTKVEIERSTHGDLILRYDDSGAPDDCRQFMVEADVTAITVLFRDMVQKPLPLHRLELRCERPRYAATLAEFFGCTIRYGCTANRSVVAASVADLPLPLANAQTLRMCEEQCRELLDQRRARSRTAERVRQCLLRPGASQSLDAVAHLLGLSGRTLRRHLHDEGTSFRRLVGEVRFALAGEMLRRDLTVEEVAERVGYAEPASFIHAFKRWTGSPPGAYRSRS